jgi:hypothetical protein
MGPTAIPHEHSLPDVEEMRTQAVINDFGLAGLRSRRRMIIASVCVLAVAAIVTLGATIASSRGSGSSSNLLGDTSSRHAEVQHFLSSYTERATLEEVDSPQYLASVWIADTDDAAIAIPSTTDYSDSYEFIQRYILAVLYFATKGSSWKFNSGFLTGDSLCDWNTGVRMDRVRDRTRTTGLWECCATTTSK